jgi:hypothetical protein
MAYPRQGPGYTRKSIEPGVRDTLLGHAQRAFSGTGWRVNLGALSDPTQILAGQRPSVLKPKIPSAAQSGSRSHAGMHDASEAKASPVGPAKEAVGAARTAAKEFAKEVRVCARKCAQEMGYTRQDFAQTYAPQAHPDLPYYAADVIAASTAGASAALNTVIQAGQLAQVALPPMQPIPKADQALIESSVAQQLNMTPTKVRGTLLQSTDENPMVAEALAGQRFAERRATDERVADTEAEGGKTTLANAMEANNRQSWEIALKEAGISETDLAALGLDMDDLAQTPDAARSNTRIPLEELVELHQRRQEGMVGAHDLSIAPPSPAVARLLSPPRPIALGLG